MESGVKHSPHGHTQGPRGSTLRSPTYNSWRGMMDRCRLPTGKTYSFYGGAGVEVDASWEVFANFLADMGERPTKDHSIDRIDGAKGYGPKNCRWATKVEQSRNQKSNRILVIDGESMCVAAWADRVGVKASLIYNRLSRGWSDERAVSQ